MQWHMIKTSGGNWSDVQQHSASTTTIGQETDDDDDDDDGDDDHDDHDDHDEIQ